MEWPIAVSADRKESKTGISTLFVLSLPLPYFSSSLHSEMIIQLVIVITSGVVHCIAFSALIHTTCD